MKKLAVVALVCILAGVLAYRTLPRARLFALAISGHSPVCPLGMAVRAHSNIVDQIAIKDRILAASHLVRSDGPLELWDTPNGPYWIPKGSRYVLPFNLAEMERHVYGSGENFIHPGDIVLDCGASDGDFTRQALAAGAKLVVAVELAPKNIECLRRNLAQPIADGRVVVYPKGVWDKDDTLPLSVDDENFAANTVVLHPENAHAAGVAPLTTIDKIAAELKLPRVDFIKMDVEGAETKALSGARETIARFHPRLAIATEHGPTDELTIPLAVRERWSGYRMECGPCLEEHGHIRPDTLYFY